MSPRTALSVLLAAALWAGTAAAAPGVANATGAVQDGVPRVEATLLSEVRQLAAGDSFRVGVHLALAPGWHVYWRNPGDAGLPTSIAWSLPPGFAACAIEWPLPVTLLSDRDNAYPMIDNRFAGVRL